MVDHLTGYDRTHGAGVHIRARGELPPPPLCELPPSG